MLILCRKNCASPVSQAASVMLVLVMVKRQVRIVSSISCSLSGRVQAGELRQTYSTPGAPRQVLRTFSTAAALTSAAFGSLGFYFQDDDHFITIELIKGVMV